MILDTVRLRTFPACEAVGVAIRLGSETKVTHHTHGMEPNCERRTSYRHSMSRRKCRPKKHAVLGEETPTKESLNAESETRDDEDKGEPRAAKRRLMITSWLGWSPLLAAIVARKKATAPFPEAKKQPRIDQSSNARQQTRGRGTSRTLDEKLAL